MELADLLFGNSFSEYQQTLLSEPGKNEPKFQLEILCDENLNELPMDVEGCHVDCEEDSTIEVEILTDLQKNEKPVIDDNVENFIGDGDHVGWNEGMSKIQIDDLQTSLISPSKDHLHCVDLFNMSNHLGLQESLDSINMFLSKLVNDNQDDLIFPTDQPCGTTDSDIILSAVGLWNSPLLSQHDNMVKVKDHRESDTSKEFTDQYLTSKFVQAPVKSKTGKANSKCYPKKKNSTESGNTGSKFYTTVVDWISRKTKDNVDINRAITGIKCPECGRQFPRAASLRRHVGCVHLGLKEYTCKTCGAEFGKKDNLQRHLLTHREDLPFSCGACDKRFSRRETLSSHILNVHKISNPHQLVENFMHTIPVSCTSLPDNQHIQEKISSRLSKTKNSRFQCDYCNSFFSSSTNLNNHIRYVHFNERKFKCELCDQLFTRKLYLREHIRKVHILINVPLCSLCNIGFVDIESLEFHKQHTHES